MTTKTPILPLVIYPLVALLGILGLPFNFIPGGDNSDLWNSMWSIDYFWSSILDGSWPISVTVLNYPKGGEIWISDPLGALLAGPFILLFGLVKGYICLLWFQTAFLGWVSHSFAKDRIEEAGQNNDFGPWIAGILMTCSSIHLSGIQNGSSESFAGGWVVLAIWFYWRFLIGKSSMFLCVLLLFFGALSSWYGAIIIAVFCGVWIIFPPSNSKKSRVQQSITIVSWVLLLLPIAYLAQYYSSSVDNIVGVKNENMLSSIRRTVGPADPLTYVLPFGYRSPDFSSISRYGEDFIHTNYIGWVAIFLAFSSWRDSSRSIFVSGIICLLLSLGPVWVQQGEAVIFADERALPLPYFLQMNGSPSLKKQSETTANKYIL